MNPFPPPPVIPQRPASLTVFGILNLIFGVMGLVGLVVSLKLYYTPLEGQTGLMADLLRAEPFYASCMRVMSVPSALYVIAMIVSGIGLLQARDGARRLAILCGVYGILAGIVNGYLTFYHVMPFTIEYTVATVKEPAIAGMMRSFTQAGTITGMLAAFAYPVVTLIFMGRKSVCDYCRSHAGETPA